LPDFAYTRIKLVHHLLQPVSSSPSIQSFIPSQTWESMMHVTSEHWYWSGVQPVKRVQKNVAVKKNTVDKIDMLTWLHKNMSGTFY